MKLTQKELLISQINQVIDQHIKILCSEHLIKNIDARAKAGINIYSRKCPVCVIEENDTCPSSCFISKDFGCIKQLTRPKDKTNKRQLQIRLMFWIELRTFLEGCVEQVFMRHNREDLYEIITEIDELVYLRHYSKTNQNVAN